MFDSDFQPSNSSTGFDRSTDFSPKSLDSFQNNAEAYGLQANAMSEHAIHSDDPLMGSSVSSGGTLLIKGGNTTSAEINEVNALLGKSIYNRSQGTYYRSYTNYSYNTGDSRALQSANETVGFDRGDSLTNAINVGTVVYRSGANVKGYAGYTTNGVRDKNDYYRFYVGKSGDVNVSLTGLSNNVGLSLYDSSKNLVAWSDKSGNSSEFVSKNLSKGTYYARVYSYNQSPWNHGATGYNLKIERQADALENYWKNLLKDSSVENAALNSIKYESHLSRTDTIGILKSAGDGKVTSTELTDLRNFYNKAINTTHVDTDVKVLSKKVLFSDRSNQWYTGSDSIRDTLGNLAAGSSADHLNLLLGKHFLGSDRPAIHRNSSNNLVGSYTQANGSLFVGGASANDLNQGATGDCYFLAALGGTANDKNPAITNMFKYNGDGTWSVRFYIDGKANYTTVDRMMPTNSSGNYIYANGGQSVAGNNELWVALAEKAYAQINESGRIGQDGNNFYGNGNNNGIGWGNSGTALKHITNLNSTSEKLKSNGIFGLSSTELINMVNSNRVVTVSGFNSKAVNSLTAAETDISNAVQKHVYVATGYNSFTGRFALRNPWGSNHLSLTYSQLMELNASIRYSNS